MFCSRGHCLCRTLQNEGTRIWGDLQDADQLNIPIHEETVTQTFALELNRKHPGKNRVHIFSKAAETLNGSDFLWVFLNEGLSQYVPVAVQAKRLYPSGRYEAFKSHQVPKILSYAKSIGGSALYLTYNYPAIRRGIYKAWAKLPFTNAVRFLDHARDFSLLYFEAAKVSAVKDGALTPTDIAAYSFPMWTAFCDCSFTHQMGPLGYALSKLRGTGLPLADPEALQPLDTPSALRTWISEGTVRERSLEELFKIDFKPEGYNPSFLLGTVLR